MHPCLHSPEILRLIIRGLWDGHDLDPGAPISTPTMPASACKALARLARTCKAFQSHALDQLWRRQVGIENLLRCMPRSLVCDKIIVLRGPKPNKKRMLCLDRAIGSSDWNRFNFYASRVMAMKLELDYSRTNVHQTVYDALAMYNKGSRPYLPNLVQLTCEPSASQQSNEMLAFCLTLLGPSLRVLRLGGRLGDMVSAPLILSYSLHLSQAVHHLDFTLGSSSETMVFFKNTLRSMDKLRILSLTLVTLPFDGIWDALSVSPTLTELTIILSPSGGIYDIPKRVDTALENVEITTLPRLRRLTLRNIHPPGCLHLLLGCSFSNVERVHIDILARTTYNHSDALAHESTFLQLLAAACGTLLRKVTLIASPGFGPNQLTPLHACPRMTHLIASISSDLDDAMIENMARAWPSLQTLRLVRKKAKVGDPPPATGVTPNGLGSLMRACPHIRNLALQLDMRHVGLSVQRPWSDLSNGHIRVLDIDGSLIDPSVPASHIAVFLTDIFPNLTTLRASGETPVGEWLEVSRLLEAFQVTRKQERQRVAHKGSVHERTHAVQTVEPMPCRRE